MTRFSNPVGCQTIKGEEKTLNSKPGGMGMAIPSHKNLLVTSTTTTPSQTQYGCGSQPYKESTGFHIMMIQFSINTQRLNGPGSNDNERVLKIPQNSRTKASA